MHASESVEFTQEIPGSGPEYGVISRALMQTPGHIQDTDPKQRPAPASLPQYTVTS